MLSLTELPAGLPVPRDDGLCRHLPGLMLPPISLASTQGGTVALSALPPGRIVCFCYPMTGRPGVALPPGWDDIPGARGCTPQACSFRDQIAEFVRLGVLVFGVSTQSSDYQREMAERLHLSYGVLSDEKLELVNALSLPTFSAGGPALIKRLTLIVRQGRIEHVLYPVFPTDRSAEQTLDWLKANPIAVNT